MLNIPPKIAFVIEKLQENGFEAYIVGGCVRDLLLNRTPNDYDITTNALPEEIMKIFEKTVPTGIKHGTVTVIAEKEPVEVTTFRSDGEYKDFRRPANVKFVSDIKEDLSRRDFTVNAMAYNKQKGVVDCFFGKEDLENKILRAVGDPEKRFREDALRILRLFRFASQLGFSIEKNTLESALKLKDSLKNISKERIFSELLKAISGEKPQALETIIKNGGLEFLGIRRVPDFAVLRKVKENANLCLFAFLYYSCESPLETLDILKASNNQKNYCKSQLTLFSLPKINTKADIKNALFLTSIEAFEDFIELKNAKGENTENLTVKLKEITEKNEPYLISHLKANGKDLKKMGYSGEEIGEKLEMLRQAVVLNPECNTAENLKKILNLP